MSSQRLRINMKVQKTDNQNNNNLPNGWRKVKLGEIVNIKMGQSPSSQFYNSRGEGLPFYQGITDFGSKYPNKSVYCTNTIKIAEKGEILFSVRAPVGEVNVAIEKSCIGRGIAALSMKNKNNEFLYYLLKYRTQYFKSISGGTTYESIGKDQIAEIELLIPEDINEQKRIASILSAFDDKIELNNKIIKTLEEMAQEIFKEWFVRFRFPGWQKAKFVDSELGKIPEGWEISKIGEKLTTILGGTPSTSNKSYWENGDIPWINSGAINDFPIINPTNFITKKGLENSAAKLMPVKTVVLPLVISIGKPVNISMLVKEMSGNQSVVGIVGNDKITPEYIYCWVQYKKQEIYGSASGGAQQHINKNIIDSTLILIPKGEILDSFNQKVVSFFDTIIKKAFENQTLAILRDLLLSKLMSGEIKI